jgi:hypothetical protein
MQLLPTVCAPTLRNNRNPPWPPRPIPPLETSLIGKITRITTPIIRKRIRKAHSPDGVMDVDTVRGTVIRPMHSLAGIWHRRKPKSPSLAHSIRCILPYNLSSVHLDEAILYHIFRHLQIHHCRDTLQILIRNLCPITRVSEFSLQL